jgi:hypothetical protein
MPLQQQLLLSLHRQAVQQQEVASRARWLLQPWQQGQQQRLLPVYRLGALMVRLLLAQHALPPPHTHFIVCSACVAVPGNYVLTMLLRC